MSDKRTVEIDLDNPCFAGMAERDVDRIANAAQCALIARASMGWCAFGPDGSYGESVDEFGNLSKFDMRIKKESKP